MKLFDFFKKKKKEEIEEPVKDEICEPVGLVNCEFCKEPIFTWDQKKTFDKKKYHVKCFRKVKKYVKSNLGSI